MKSRFRVNAVRSSVPELSVGPRGMIAYETQTTRTGIWSLPLDRASDSEATLLVSCPEEHCMPALAKQGSALTYAYYLHKGWRFAAKDLRTGLERQLAAAGPVAPWIATPASGAPLYYSSEGDGPYTIYRTAEDGGGSMVVATASPQIWDSSADGRWLLTMGLGTGREVRALDVSTGRHAVYLDQPPWSLYRARFSPSGHAVAFTAKTGPDRSALYIAPFRHGKRVAASEWIALTAADSYHGPPAWSESGDAIYFASERDGHRCLWMRRLDADGMRPAGEITPVRHFHNPRWSLSNVRRALFAMSVSGRTIAFNAAERTAGIWMSR